MRPVADIAGSLIAVAISAVVVVRVANAPEPPHPREATPQERAGFAANVASQEADWSNHAADDFPADHWSQRDAFHGHEAAAVRDLARGAAGVSYESVFRAIDEDLHRLRGSDRNVTAVPCKPRPVFD